MKARLMPLEGKYYGSELQVTHKGITGTIELWCSADYVVSERESEYAEFSHCESQWTYEVLTAIEVALSDKGDHQ